MKKSKPKSIQSSIFNFTAAIILLLTISSVLLYYFTMSIGFVRNYTESSEQLTKLLSSRMDTIVREVDLLERRLLESTVIREYIFKKLPTHNDRNIYIEEREFEETIYSISGYDYPFHHISIFTFDGYLVSFGEKYGFEYNPDYNFQGLVEPITKKNGSLLIKPLNAEKLESYRPSISLCRSFSLYPLNPPKAVIEIQVDALTFEKAVSESIAAYNNLSNQVIILNENQELVHPTNLDSNSREPYFSINSSKKEKNPATNQEEIVTKYTSPYTGWTTIVVTPYAAVAHFTREYLIIAIGVGTLALVILLFISHRISRNISAPIIEIKDSLSDLNLENLGQVAPNILSDYNELELLTEAFQLMEKRLEESLEDYVEMRSLSVQSQLRALQSQINPHFLYNTLSIISILAEENKDYLVAEMGRQLVDMLRYSSKENLRTTIGAEINHAKNYAKLMEVRFGEKMHFDFIVDDALLEVEAPSMMIQPLIENCVKYAGTGKNGKLIIVTVGEVYDDSWVMQISDNGKGFSDEALEQFDKAISNTDTVEEIMQQDQTGIGLANIYKRLYLYYGGKSIFKIDNSDYGAIVTIGGQLEGKFYK